MDDTIKQLAELLFEAQGQLVTYNDPEQCEAIVRFVIDRLKNHKTCHYALKDECDYWYEGPLPTMTPEGE